MSRIPNASRSAILCIDDEPAFLGLLRKLLEQEGYTVRTAASGEKGLAQFALEAPDLVVLDVLMPGMDGYTVLQRLRAQGDVPVVMLTGNAPLNDVLNNPGGEVPDAYVDKGMEMDQLVPTIHYLVRTAQR
jgi:CheY-like chemotaxis protein